MPHSRDFDYRGPEEQDLRTARREADVLANMAGADSQRIDSLVGVVGEVRGQVSHLTQTVSKVGEGVDELRGAMTVLTRHSIALETHAEKNAVRDAVQADMNKRLHVVETTLAAELPPLKEARTWQVRAMLFVLTAVGVVAMAIVLSGKVAQG